VLGVMEDIRELQRQKWLKAQEMNSGSDGGGQSASSSSASAVPAAVASEEPEGTAGGPQAAAAVRASIRRVHILPVGSSTETSGRSTLELLAPALKERRREKVPIRTGQFIRSAGFEFIVVKCEPDMGVLDTETDYFVDGDPVVRYSKVQFICLWDFESPNRDAEPSILFKEYISPYFKSVADSGEDVGNIVAVNETMKIFDLDFQVNAAEPSPPEIGIIDQNTMVFVDWDLTPEFDRIHIVPFQDTLPHAYDFEVFSDYLKPYLTRNKHMRFAVNDQFTYQGVQFKVVCAEPTGPARIGKNTTIFCEGVLHPSLRNLLPPGLLEQLSHLPPGLQMLLLNTEALAGGYEERLMEVQEMLSRPRGMASETISQVEEFIWDSTAAGTASSQTQCMVCLSTFEDGERARRLPCHHVFHTQCIDEWLRRCTDCPICKANVDRAVREY